MDDIKRVPELKLFKFVYDKFRVYNKDFYPVQKNHSYKYIGRLVIAI